MQGQIFDLQGAMERLGGDEELFHDLVRFFLEDSPGLLEQLRTGLERRDASLVERAAHSLKGLAGNFGADDAVQKALEIERLGREGQLDRVEPVFPQLEERIVALQTALAAYRASNGG